jgi:hypothetical protein
MKTKRYLPLLAAVGLVASLGLASTAFADTNNTQPTPAPQGQREGRGMEVRARMIPRVFGTVASINGNIITVTSVRGEKDRNRSTTTFTIDATNAKIFKNNATSTIQSIVTGDTIVARGTLKGTNLVATEIRDGKPMMGRGDNQNDRNGQKENDDKNKRASSTPVIVGNGQPVVGGSVTTINGSTLTITNKSGVVYTIDATNAVIQKGDSKSTVASIAVGDTVVVQGSVNGQSIVASSVLDQANVPKNDGESKSASAFFGGIKNFFSHMFGF